METRQLRYFLEVADELNFNRAAKRLNLSQPALSRAIQNLEDEIPARLLERNSKRVVLTEAGRVFYNHARTIISHIEQAADEARHLSMGQIGSLAVGIYGSAIMDLVPEVMHRFSLQSPGVRVTLHAMDKDAQIQALRERRIAVAFNRHAPDEPDITQHFVRTEPLVVAIPESNLLTARELIDLGEILDQPLVLYPTDFRSSLVGKILALYSDYAATPVIAQHVADASTAIALVSAGTGVSLVPRSASSIRMPRVVYRPLKARRLAVIELVCMHRRDDSDPILRSFMDVVHEASTDVPDAPADPRPRRKARP